MKFSIIYFLAIALTLAISPAVAQQPAGAGDQDAPNEKRETYIISGIDIQGAEYSDPNAIVSLSGLAVGNPITLISRELPDGTKLLGGQEVAQVLKRLWNENIFSNIEISVDEINGRSIKLMIAVTERPRIASIQFTGISKSQAEDLKEKINFINGTILTESKEQSAKRIIRNFYVEKGFYNVSVDINESLDNVIRNGVTVQIDVDKGKRTKIYEIAIEGNEDFSDRKVKRNLKKVKERKWWRFWARSKYVPKTFREAKDNLIQIYHDEGYRDAQVLFDTVRTINGKLVQVRMEVYEGEQYYFRDIAWSGNLKYNSVRLSQVLGIDKGDIYSESQLQKRLNGDPQGGDVSSLYLDDGYLFFNVQPVEVAVEGDSIDLELRIQEGPQSNNRKIIIEGNDKTSDYVINRELRTSPGEKFSRSEIIRSQREIINLGYFDQEKLGVNPIPNQATGTVDIAFNVTERSADQLQLQGGWGQRLRDANGNVFGGGFIGTVQLAFNNFSTKRFLDPKAWRPVPSGDGQKLNLAVQMNGLGNKNLSISFLEPWLGGKKPNSLGVSASYFIFQRGNFFTRSNLFRNAIFTSSVDFRQRLTFPDDFFTLSSSLTFRYFDVQNPSINDGGIFRGFEGEPQAFINAITIRETLSRTSIDAPIYPRSGSQMSISVELTPPYSLFRGDRDYAEMTDSEKFNLLEYHKWTFNSNWFFNIAGNMVLNARLEAGFLGAYNQEIGISPFERYYLGGAGLQAGFGFDGREIIPLRGYEDFSVTNNNDGYPIYNRFLLELRQPITLNQSSPVWVLGFLEGGNGYTDIRKYNPFDLKRSVGVGLRVMLPMVGLLGLDYGYGFDNINSQRSGGQFHFIMGQQL